MLWANKTWTLARFTNGTYNDIISGYRFRYNPNKSESEKTFRLRQDHIEYRLFGDPVDIKTGDKLTESTWQAWTIIGIDPFGDQMWKHIEVTMRMRDSDVHQPVTIRKKSILQPNYDPVLKEYTNNNATPEHIDTVYNALVDENQKHKEKWIKEIGAGKYETIDYILTLELDQKITKEDMVTLPDGDVYLVDWIYTLPYQIFYWLKKTFKNNSYE